MDTATKLIISLLLATFYAPAAIAYEFHDPYPNVKIIDGDLHISRPGGGTSLAYPNAGISKEIPVNTSKGQFLVPVEKTFPVEPSKVGKAAIRFVRSLPLIGTGLAIYDTLCDLSDICSSNDGSGNLIQLGPDPIIWSSEGPLPTGCDVPGGSTAYYNYLSSGYEGAGVYAMYHSVLSPSCNGFTPPAGMILHSFCPAVPGSGCGSSASYRNRTGVAPPRTETPISESDWIAAETKLNAQPQQTAESLYNSDAPVPVSASTQSDPVTQQIAQTSTQTKDAQGNVTGTQTATTTVTVTDTSTTNNVTYNITETTTITHFNENNEITGTETSTSDNQPPTRTDETTISFDDVPPAQLEEEQPEFNLEAPESWGEGTCPPDEILTVQGVTFPVSWQPACDTAVQLRPIFVLFASVAAMFIVAGISRAGT